VWVPFWLAGVAGGPFWHGGKGACGCLFGWVARVSAFLACRRVCVPSWLVGACVCLLGLLALRVCAFLTCWNSWWAFFVTEGRARVCAFLVC